jgi:hypothetical protein
MYVILGGLACCEVLVVLPTGAMEMSLSMISIILESGSSTFCVDVFFVFIITKV